MPVTRAQEYPPEWAQLFQAFNHCADGHELHQVVDVAANFLVATVVNNATMRGHSREQVMSTTAAICESISQMVDKNFRRVKQSADVAVQSN